MGRHVGRSRACATCKKRKIKVRHRSVCPVLFLFFH